MKRTLASFALAMLILLPACGRQTKVQDIKPVDSSSGMTWQEQYDLGMRYLTDGNYTEAIIAFTAAIEIDPKQAPVYVGRGQAYLFSGETEVNLTAAQADYEKAIGLDEAYVEAYLGLADVFIYRKDYDRAIEILRQGLKKTNDNPQLAEKIEQIEKSMGNDTVELTEEEELILSDIMVHLENRDYDYIYYTYSDPANVKIVQDLCRKASEFSYDGEKLVKEYRGIGLRILPSVYSQGTIYYGEIDIKASGEGVVITHFIHPEILEKNFEYYTTVDGMWNSDLPNGVCTWISKAPTSTFEHQDVRVQSGLVTNGIFDGEIQTSVYDDGEVRYRYSCLYNLGHQVLDERWTQINDEWTLPFEEGRGLGVAYQPDFVFRIKDLMIDRGT